MSSNRVAASAFAVLVFVALGLAVLRCGDDGDRTPKTAASQSPTPTTAAGKNTPHRERVGRTGPRDRPRGGTRSKRGQELRVCRRATSRMLRRTKKAHRRLQVAVSLIATRRGRLVVKTKY